MDSESDFSLLKDQRIEDKDLAIGVENYISESIIQHIYPEKIIKRIIFKPFLGKYYPYVEIWSPYYETAYTFLYDIVDMWISNVKRCIGCDNDLNSENTEDIFIPIALCCKCKERVHLIYWKCCKNIINKSIKLSDKYTQIYKLDRGLDNNQKITCDNFLEPTCNYPLDEEYINPCLKNQAIGLIITNNCKIMIIVAHADIIKYNIISQGGIFALIFGYSDRIMNLEILEEILINILQLVKEAIQDYNAKFDNAGEKRDFLLLNYYVPINKMDMDDFYKLLTINYLNYYNIEEINVIINNYIKEYLDVFIEIVYKIQKETNLEILDFLDLFRIYSPLKYKFREFIENKISEELKFQNTEPFLNNFNIILKKENLMEVFDKINNLLKKYILVKKNLDSMEEFIIHEIYCSMGSILVVKTNLNDNPIIITAESLIGKLIK
ncbi:MAG: hypothetical protein JXA99_12970 [Candidatus Lokiarchaeota archaeon]|nr:hypothetical protein [Candidatus Lokiarchaeota archaeon]